MKASPIPRDIIGLKCSRCPEPAKYISGRGTPLCEFCTKELEIAELIRNDSEDYMMTRTIALKLGISEESAVEICRRSREIEPAEHESEIPHECWKFKEENRQVELPKA